MPVGDSRFDAEIEVERCGRCRYAHRNLPVKKFTNPPHVVQAQTDSMALPTHYGICPITNEPILLFPDNG